MKSRGDSSLADAHVLSLADERDATLVVGADDDFDGLSVDVDLRRFREDPV